MIDREIRTNLDAATFEETLDDNRGILIFSIRNFRDENLFLFEFLRF